MQYRPWKWLAFALCLLSVSSVPLRAQECDLFAGLPYGQDLLLDLLVPRGAAAPTPLVIWIHGGGWRTGSRAPLPDRAAALCAQGYAVAGVDYRFSNTALWPAQIQDVKGAVRWLRAHASTYNLDAGRFGVWGESAGGHLAAILGTSGGVASITVGGATADLEGTTGGNAGVSSRVQAVVDWYGATDVLQMHFYPTSMNHDAATSDEGRLLGGPIQDDPDRAATANAITYVTPDDPPFLVVHGTLDKTNPFNQSELLVDALAGSGVPVDFLPVQNAGHGGSAFNAAGVLQTVYAFFDATLRGADETTAVADQHDLTVTTAAAPAGATVPAGPFVSVSAIDRDASEPGTNKGAFLLWRTGSTVNPLTVGVTVSGTADGGIDYAAVPSTVTFPAGADHVAVSIAPLEDYVTEETESVALAVEPVPGFDLGPYTGARVWLADDDAPGLPVLTVLSLVPASVTGGGSSTGTVTLDAPAPAGGAVVSLGTDDSAVATVPAGITVPAGASSATFKVASKPVATNTTVQVTASYRGAARTAPLSVQAPTLSGLTLTPSTLAGGAASTGKVTLNGKAPGGGLVVSLANDNPAAGVPASVAVAAGASSATFPISTTAVTATQSGAVTASFSGVTKSVKLTVKP